MTTKWSISKNDLAQAQEGSSSRMALETQVRGKRLCAATEEHYREARGGGQNPRNQEDLRVKEAENSRQPEYVSGGRLSNCIQHLLQVRWQSGSRGQNVDRFLRKRTVGRLQGSKSNPSALQDKLGPATKMICKDFCG